MKKVVTGMQVAGGATVLTVPNVDYVSADKNADGDVRKTPDYLATRFKNNVATKEAPFESPPNATDGAVYQDEFVWFLAQTFPGANLIFDLDNEPDLWSETHPEVHPEKVGYAELVERNTRFATAIKAVAPTAPVAGFVSYGWTGYVNLQGAPDSQGDFIDYYLDRMKAAEKAAGQRLIDYLDLHWYPEATGGGKRIVWSGGDETTPEQVLARVQAPRSLWDFTYQEKSYIAASGPVVLLPRMKKKIRDHYPGTQLAFTEWNYGASDHISGAIATADVLGIFAREGVGLSTIWPSGREPFNQAAVRVFRDYDGAGAKFGDQYVWAKTNSVFSSSVHAAVDSTNKQRLVIVAINKRSAATTAAVHIKSATTYMGASVFVLQGAKATIQPSAPVATTAANELSYEMPPLSVSVLVPYVGEPPPVPEPPVEPARDGGVDAAAHDAVPQDVAPLDVATTEGGASGGAGGGAGSAGGAAGSNVGGRVAAGGEGGQGAPAL